MNLLCDVLNVSAIIFFSTYCFIITSIWVLHFFKKYSTIAKLFEWDSYGNWQEVLYCYNGINWIALIINAYVTDESTQLQFIGYWVVLPLFCIACCIVLIILGSIITVFEKVRERFIES